MLGTMATISEGAARRGGDSHAAACCLQAAGPCGQSNLPALLSLRGWRFRHRKDEGPMDEPEVLGAQRAHAEGVGLAIGRDAGDVAQEERVLRGVWRLCELPPVQCVCIYPAAMGTMPAKLTTD